MFVETFCSADKLEKEIRLFIGVKHKIDLLFLGAEDDCKMVFPGTLSFN